MKVATRFLIRKWAGTHNPVWWWATIIWQRRELSTPELFNANHCAANDVGCLDCPAAPTRKGAERIGREYARRLGLRLPRPRYS
jgi:hypothetical protein